MKTMEPRQFRSRPKAGEALAMRPEAMFWMFAPAAAENEIIGDVGIVHIRGPLEHHADSWSDNYDAIKSRVFEALESDEAKSIVIRIDSPGGVVSGLNQTVYEIRKAARDAGKKIYAYVDELAASAAYAMACIADEIYLPPSGIAGSIGVISTMYEQTKKDEKEGYRFVTLISGERKDDGHPHVPISADAINAEQKRVNRLAKQFYRLVSKARGLSVDEVAGFKAGLFTGTEAVKAGVADGVMGFDSLIEQISLAQSGTTSSSLSETLVGPQTGKKEMAKIKSLIAAWSKQLATASGTKRERLLADISMAKQMMRKMSEESEESAESEEEDAEKCEDADGNETDRDEEDEPSDDKKDGDDSDEEDEESDEGDEEEEEESAKTSASVYRAAVKMTGKRSPSAVIGALTSLVEKARKHDALADRVAKIEARDRAQKRQSMIDDALRGRRITRAEAKQLATKKTSFVTSYLEMRPKAIVTSADDAAMPAYGLDATAIAQESGAVPDNQPVHLDAKGEQLMEQAFMSAQSRGLKLSKEDFLKRYKAQLNGANARRF